MTRARFVKAGVVFLAMTVFFVFAFLGEESTAWRTVLAIGGAASATMLLATIVAYRKMHR